MNLLLVDDEQLALQDLTYAVKQALPDATAYCFNKAKEALEFAKDNKIDIAFLDINMRVVNGISMANKLIEIWPNINIIFCTGYSEYMKDAFNLHASGYLNKPVTVEAIKEEVNNLRYEVSDVKPLVYIDKNHYIIYDFDNKVIEFKRKLSKELFKILLNANSSSTVDSLCNSLWENDDKEKNKNYLMQLLTDIRHSFEDRKIYGILCKDINGYYINTLLIKII